LLLVGVDVCLDFDHFGLVVDAVCWLLVLLFGWLLIILVVFDAVCWLLVLLFGWILIILGCLLMLFAGCGCCCLVGF
jgi:hypothetical protein